MFGKKNPNPNLDEKVSVSEAELFPGKEDLVNGPTIDVSDFPLFDDSNYQPVVLLMRVDLLKGAVQTRYALVEKRMLISLRLMTPR